MESRIRDNTYITILPFMVRDLKLKGNDLLVYAIIYGFSQDESSWFRGSVQYMADWTNSSKQGIRKCLKKLIDSGLIEKLNADGDGETARYRVAQGGNSVDRGGNSVAQGGQLSCSGGATQFPQGGNSVAQGGQLSCPNNIIYNNNISIADIIENSIERPVTPKTVMDLFNQFCVSLPKITSVNGNRAVALKNRIAEHPDTQWWIDFFTRVEKSDFLTGKKKDFRANFDWIIKPSNATKISEGNYDNRDGAEQQLTGYGDGWDYIFSEMQRGDQE